MKIEDNDMNGNRVTTREFYDKLTEVELRLIARLDRMSEDILALQLSKAELAGKADQSELGTVRTLAFIGIAISMLSVCLKVFGL